MARVAGGETATVQMALDMPTGHRIYKFSMRPVFDAAGTVIAMVPEAIEITAQMQAEEGWRQATELNRANDRKSALLDFGDRLRGMQQPDDIALAAGRIIGQTFGLAHAAYAIVHTDGDSATVLKPWSWPAEDLAFMRSVADRTWSALATAGRKATCALNFDLQRKVEARTAERDRVWRNSQDLLCIVDGRGILQAANPAWFTILGWRPDELVGRNHLSVNHPDDQAASAAVLAKASNQSLSAYEARIRHKDTSYRWISWTASGEGDLVYASGQDVTEEKTARANLEVTQEALRRTHATDRVSIADLKAANPAYVPVMRMALPRKHPNLVLLPDRTVFASGGSLKQEDEPLSRLQSELYDPVTNIWRLTATATFKRLYHSTALLLPDARVVAAGGKPEGGKSVKVEPPDPKGQMHLEIFSPPYLFRGPRPTITNAPAASGYGQAITIASPESGAIRWVSLIRNGVMTHYFDNGQRLVDLPIVAQNAAGIRVTMPA